MHVLILSNLAKRSNNTDHFLNKNANELLISNSGEKGKCPHPPGLFPLLLSGLKAMNFQASQLRTDVTGDGQSWTFKTADGKKASLILHL